MSKFSRKVKRNHARMLQKKYKLQSVTMDLERLVKHPANINKVQSEKVQS